MKTVRSLPGLPLSPIEETNPRYDSDCLKEFGKIIDQKLDNFKEEIKGAQDTLLNLEIPASDAFNASEVVIRDEASALMDHAERSVELAMKAKERIRNKVYGVCFTCKPSHLIPKEELRLAPFRTKCIKAKKAEPPIVTKRGSH